MYTYVGTAGAHHQGIPARDLSAEEFAALDKDQQATVKASKIYEATKPEPKPSK